MNTPPPFRTFASGCSAGVALLAAGLVLLPAARAAGADALRINGPSVFGARPGWPFLYKIPAVGGAALHYAVSGLPAGLAVDETSGIITGVTPAAGTYATVLEVRAGASVTHKPFRLVSGETIGLTPAMGWNSWNCWAGSVDQAKVLKAAQAMARTGLVNHGWTYINIDDTWQGRRDPQTHALQANEKFPDLAGLCATVHQLGLKAGIYSTPWVTSYANYAGGSSDAADGAWTAPKKGSREGWRHGRYPFAEADARQWGQWGFDYLKYDWNPNDVPHVAEMAQALRQSGRDIIFSLSNAAPLGLADQWQRLANSWRTTGDIRDLWIEGASEQYFYGVSEIGFSQDPWAAFAGPGHFNDPDMLVIGQVGWKAELRPTRLTPDEQLTHLSLWCLLSAPLLLGCDLDHLDDFTLSLLTNDEVLALDQDALGIAATRAATAGAVDIYRKPLEDHGIAVGFFNRSDAPVQLVFGKFGALGAKGSYQVRDLWQHADGAEITGGKSRPWQLTVPAHGVVLYRLTPKS